MGEHKGIRTNPTSVFFWSPSPAMQERYLRPCRGAAGRVLIVIRKRLGFQPLSRCALLYRETAPVARHSSLETLLVFEFEGKSAATITQFTESEQSFQWIPKQRAALSSRRSGIAARPAELLKQGTKCQRREWDRGLRGLAGRGRKQAATPTRRAHRVHRCFGEVKVQQAARCRGVGGPGG